MNSDLINQWNSDHLKIPKGKQVSRYAVEKEVEFPRNSSIVDLGGGTGVDALYFAEHGHQIHLIDISDTALTIAKEKFQAKNLPVITYQVDLGKDSLPLEDNSVAIIYSRLALHYFTAKEMSDIFKEIYRILKQGGIAYLTVKSPNDQAEMDFLRKTADEIEDGVFSEQGKIKSRFTIKQLENMLMPIGFAQFNVYEYLEDMSGRVDKIKSGNLKQLLNEIILDK